MKPHRYMSISKRFWMRVAKTKNCWNWTGSVYKYSPYGRIWKDGKAIFVHRFSFELHYGKIPKGKEIDHLCRNPKCVNPTHLEAVSHRINVLRGTGVSAKYSARTHCKHGHPFTEVNTRLYEYKVGLITRRCRECGRMRDQKKRNKP